MEYGSVAYPIAMRNVLAMLLKFEAAANQGVVRVRTSIHLISDYAISGLHHVS